MKIQRNSERKKERKKARKKRRENEGIEETRNKQTRTRKCKIASTILIPILLI